MKRKKESGGALGRGPQMADGKKFESLVRILKYASFFYRREENTPMELSRTFRQGKTVDWIELDFT